MSFSDEDGTKPCNDCGEHKPLSDFWRRAASSDGLSHYCKPCFRLRNARSHRRRAEREGRDVRPYVPYRQDVPEGMGWCAECDKLKPLTDFFKNGRYRRGHSYYCKACATRRTEASPEKHHGSSRDYHLMRRYGITSAEVERMVEAQGGVCTICRTPDPQHVDHDHVTGEVRGVICFNCNGGLGQFKDDPQLLANAQRYLMGEQCRSISVMETAFRRVLVEYRPRASTTS